MTLAHEHDAESETLQAYAALDGRLQTRFIFSRCSQALAHRCISQNRLLYGEQCFTLESSLLSGYAT